MRGVGEMRLAKPCAVCGDVVEFIIPDSPQWISADDEFPECGTCVFLVVDRTIRHAFRNKYKSVSWWEPMCGDEIAESSVTHWMYEPELPKDE